MQAIGLIYYPLLEKYKKVSYEKSLNLEEISDSLKTFDTGLKLLKESFPEIEIDHAFGTAHNSLNIFGSSNELKSEWQNSSKDVLRYHLNLYGEQEILKKGAIIYLENCGLPNIIGGNYKILNEYFESKEKKLHRRFFDISSMRIIMDKK
ncbi:hypothetical protein HOD29_03235 [archaeon]|jgi:hypothetical protein|nr:hypothetical protein [archaeon]